jgi:hypothetical protein
MFLKSRSDFKNIEISNSVACKATDFWKAGEENLDFGSALIYQFRDPRWIQKGLVAALLSLIPVFGQIFVFGWALGITRRMIHRESELLPEINLAEDFVRGLKVWGINLIYGLPLLVVAVPLVIGIGLLLANRTNGSMTFWGMLILCLIVGLIAYGLLLVFALPAAYAIFIAHHEQFSAALNFEQVYRLIRNAPVPYFMVFIGGIVCGLITFFGLAGCIIGVVLSSTYSFTVIAHLYGQAYLESTAAY